MIDSKKRHLVQCPTCRKSIIEQNGKTSVLRNRIIIFTEDAVLAYCPRCKAKVRVPIKLTA